MEGWGACVPPLCPSHYVGLLDRVCQGSVMVSLSCGRVCQGSEKMSLPIGLRCRAAHAWFCHSLLRVSRPDGLQCLTFYCPSRLRFGRMSWPFGLQILAVGSQPLGDVAASCTFMHGALSVPHRRLRGCSVVFCCGAADHACLRGASARLLVLYG